jgi:RNA polymerase sigma-70 factor, ECF subfamily
MYPEAAVFSNQKAAHGVFNHGRAMDALVADDAEAVVILDDTLEREFVARLEEASRLAFRVALGVLHNRADAEDVAQEALVRAYQNLGRLRGLPRFRAWLVRIVWRLALDHRRSAGRRALREASSAGEASPPSVEDLAASSEFQEHLERAMDELPEKLRIVLVLAGVEGYDTREVAGLLGLPEGTIKSRLHAARKKLAERLRWTASDTRTG